MSILTVDDSVHVHNQLQAFLSTAGYSDLLFCGSAQEAFAVLGINDSTVQPTEVELILMDIEMEDMQGIEAVRHIKIYEEFEDVPIIMVTADTSDKSLEAAFQAGAVDYITKPIRKIELLARVKSFLRLKREVEKRKARQKELVRLTFELEYTNKELLQANEQLNKIALSDGLTGIPNRRYFNETIKSEWKRCVRVRKSLALMMIDIDYFKLYNDLYGHLQGDNCLKSISRQMKFCMKRPADFIARYGGEEFVAVLPETEIDGAVQVCQDMREAIAELNMPHENSDVSGRVTVSLGIAAMLPAGDNSAGKLIMLADQALYQAKTEGRNRYKVSDE